MKPLTPAGEAAWWGLRSTITFVVILLFLRTVVEYVPALEALPPIGPLLRWWDPVMSDLLRPLGIPWSHDVRGIGLPAVAIALIFMRSMADDILSNLAKPRRRSAPREQPDGSAPEVPAAAVAPAAGAVAPPPAPPPAAEANADPNATMLKPQPAATSVSSSGTRFSPLARPAAPAAPVTRIGRYDIVEELGRGAMGVVYKGLDPTIGRTVAIKTISAVGVGPEIDEYRARFLVEARSAGRLNHPGIVSVHDVTDDESGRPSLVLEFVAGTPFDKLLSGKTLSLSQSLDVVAQTARALEYAHLNGIVHRDVKPANIMVTAELQAKLSDFGIAKIEGTTMTVAGQVLGTPAFMSPEQCTGSNVDARSDIFSLGSVLYSACTGERAFPGTTFTAVAYKVVHQEAIPPTQLKPDLPPELDRIVARCLAKAPEARYASAGEVAADLANLRAALD